MSTRSSAFMLAALVLAVLAGGCVPGTAATRVPVGWLPRVGAAPPGSDGYGAWVSVGKASGFRSERFEGELIACDRDSLWVLTAEGLVAVPVRFVRGLTLFKAVRADGSLEERRMTFPRPEDLSESARFPQGLPPGLDRARIRPKVITWR